MCVFAWLVWFILLILEGENERDRRQTLNIRVREK